MLTLTKIARHRVFNGFLERYQHQSDCTRSDMTFSIYLPDYCTEHADITQKLPCIYWLSGLTCTDENFATKAGAFQYASQLGIVIIIPDTSPRGAHVPDDASYSLGQGASFYLNATENSWSQHYHMYDYVVAELPQLIAQHFPVSDKKSIMGHSMGGHGALMIGLKNADKYQSISAFAPIVHPCETSWGQTAFRTYLGGDVQKWQAYDSWHCLDHAARQIPILIHQGLADEFYPQELTPETFVEKAKRLRFPISYYPVDGYDHSYYFITSFIQIHFDFHAQYLHNDI